MKRLLIIWMMCMPALAHAQMPPPVAIPRVLAVTGEAHKEIKPDQAVLNVSIVSQNMSLDEAKHANDKLTKKVHNIALDLQIPEKNIATSGLYVSPQYNHNNGKRTLNGYMINRSLRITMDTMDVHERLLSEVIAAGVDQVSGVEFKLAKPEKQEQVLRGEAVRDAQSKAKVLAEAAGMELGKPISIASDGAAPVMAPMPMHGRAMHMSAAESSSDAPSLPGMIRLQQSVSIVYELK